MHDQQNTSRWIAFFLILLPIAWIGLRIFSNQAEKLSIHPKHKFEISYQFDIRGEDDYWVKTYLPASSQRQRIEFQSASAQASDRISIEGENKVIRWEGGGLPVSSIRYTFQHEGTPISYQIDSTIQYAPVFDSELESALNATDFIQAEDPKIAELAGRLSQGKEALLPRLQAFYEFVYAIPSIATSDLTDAVTALENFEASCNGKSRLFVALCRNQKIPARVVGGLILEDVKKKTSHLWAEVFVEGQWVPFDALNGHFASLPAHYLELYRGDEFLITRKAGINFDYLYEINKKRVNHYPRYAMLNLWALIDQANIQKDMLQMLLLLPLGAFLVALFKNVIGVKTFGVFLPVLISLALIQTGMLPGLVLFSIIVLVVATVSVPLDRWGIQYTSKIALMLIAVVLTSLIGVNVLHQTNWLSANAPLFFPIIILTIISERFAKKVDEEGVGSALNLYVQTIAVTLFIYFILSSVWIQHFVLTFPESILMLAGLNLLLGKWIGLRLTEYRRFYQVINS